MRHIKLFIQGFIIGLGKIMPGVSGSVMAITFGIYEKLIKSLSSFKQFKKNIKFISILFLGIGISILIGSNAIKYFLTNYYLKTLMFFIGMMIPGIFPIVKCVKNKDLNFKRLAVCILVFLILLFLNSLNFKTNNTLNEPYLHSFISLVICGLLDAFSTVVPGISGSALLMLFGYYERIITSLANILTFTDLLNSILVLIPFFIGLILGIVLTSKLITYLFNNHRVITYMMIIVFATFSVLALLSNTFSFANSFGDYIFALIFLVFGGIFTCLMEMVFKE